jgi:hypothetical protein
MKGKIFLSFMVGMALGTTLGASLAFWLQPREPDKGVTVERLGNSEGGAIYRIQVP